MNGTRYRLAYVDGCLCVASETTDFFEPIKRTHYFRVRNGDMLAKLGLRIGEELIFSRVGEVHVYRYSDPNLPRREYTVQPDEPAIHVEEEPVPEPSARGKETRWKDGRWERFLQTRGWVPC